MLLCGQPGIGKTHLAEELLTHLSCRSLKVHARTSERALVAALPAVRLKPDWADVVFAQVMRGESVTQVRLRDALAAHLLALAPFVLYLEDLHEVGTERSAFWSDLARVVQKLRGVGLLATSREVRPGFTVLEVPELVPGDSRALLEAEAGVALPEEAVSWIRSWARGNPLFTKEYFRFLARRGHLWSDGQTWRWRVPETPAHPPTVEALVAERLALVSDPLAQRLLDARSLLPTEAADEAAEIAQLTPPQAEEARQILHRVGILERDDFAHPLYREVHLSGANAGRLRTLARRALDVLATRPELAALFLDRADTSPEQAGALLRSAASAARRRGNAEQEAQFLWRASLHARGPRRAALALRAARTASATHQGLALTYARAAEAAWSTRAGAFTLADLLARTGEGEQARAVLVRHRGEAPSPDWLLASLEAQVTCGDDRGAVSTWQDLEAGMSALPDGQEQAILALAASAFLNLGDLEQALALATRGLDAVESDSPHAAPSPVAQCPAAIRRAHTRLARRPGREEVRARLLNVLSGVAYFRGEFDQALAWQDQALTRSLAEGRPTEGAGLLGSRALIRSAQGQPGLAAADLEAAMRLYASAGQGRQHAFQQQRLGALLARMGIWERAEEQLLEARAVLTLTDTPGWQAEVEGELARLYLEWVPARGEVRALRHARAAVQAARLQGSRAYLMDALFALAWAEAQHGEARVAQETATELAGLANGPSVGRGYAFWAEGLALEALGQTETAVAALRSSLETFDALNIGVLSWRVQIELGRLSQNPELIRAAVQYFEERGLHGRALAGKRSLPELPGPAEKAVGTVSGATTLELRLLGPLEVWRGGEPLPLRGRQARLLLAILGHTRLSGQAEVSQLGLSDLLYPGWPEHQATAALHQLVHRLRGALGPGIISRTPLGYALGEGVSTDAAEFLSTRDSSLWRGPYLEGEDPGGTAGGPLYQALREVVEAEAGQVPARTVFLAELLLNAAPFDQEMWRSMLLILRRARAYRKLARSYAAQRTLMAEVGEHLPVRWQEFLDPS